MTGQERPVRVPRILGCMYKIMAMADESIRELLKIPIHEIIEHDAKGLIKSLKKYLVPNKSRGRSSLPTFKSNDSNNTYWPFVKEVHIQGPFEVLRNGIVLVDVPGSGDINEGRSQVAKKVLDITDHIWIVSDIKRAMSEESTANILGESLRDQVNYIYFSQYFLFLIHIN